MKLTLASALCLLSASAQAFDRRDMGDMFNAFGGLTFALASPLGALSGAMSGYVTGDLVTLKCNNVGFSTAPVVTVTAASGVVTATSLTNSGVTVGELVAGGVTQCSQASTTGSGKGLQVNVKLGPIAANGGGGGGGTDMLTVPNVQHGDLVPAAGLPFINGSGFYAISQ